MIATGHIFVSEIVYSPLENRDSQFKQRCVHSTHVGKHVHRHSQTLISTHIYKQRKCLKMYKTDGQIQNSKERERDMNKDRKVKLGIDNKVLPKTLPV